MGTSGDYPPFSDWKAERPSGFSVALVEAFATEHGLEPTWVRFRWPELVGDFRAGRFELAASGITVRPERSVLGRYTVPVVRNGAVLLLRRPSWAPPPARASSRADLGQALAELGALDQPALRVAVNRGGHLERVARSLFHQAQVLAIPDNAAVREALATGQVDAALSNTLEGPRWAEGLEGIEQLGPLTRDVVALYVRPDQPELAARLDAWLMAQEQSGELGRLRARYLGPGAAGTTARPVEALLAATAERLALMPLVAAAKQRAGTPVEDSTQEARVRESFRALVREAAAALNVVPPPDEALDAFTQAQMNAAKAVQRRVPLDAGGPVFSLEQELRPAVARVSAKMAALVVRLPAGLEPATVSEQARDWLGASGLEAAEVERLARTLAALRPGPPTP
ncbi:transporter substrate-binding domain-containing protein [Archangium sp.]|uniref:transporter substrate-binding domain-containing protein n=1 Tax=Archangium sp. TaxID=1872627 RepID=UPI002D6FBFE3|nr:transporter substrate-binding domain-containing protein [Archangium sp.]HYO54607.1 transporter substrate-binding domain-containing protein [Archangium sp.]